MNKHQQQVDEWFTEQRWSYWSPHEILARLFEEGGELARLVNHTWGPKKKKHDEEAQHLEEEVGDIIYTLICFANSQGIDLDRAVQRSIDKVVVRDKNRFLS